MSADDLERLASEYVLGTLEADERRVVQERMKVDPALAHAVAQWEARLLPLVSLAEPQAPSPGLWPRIAASTRAPATTSARQTRRSSGRLSGWLDSLAFWRGLSLAGLSAAALMAVLLVTQPPAPQYLVVLAAPQSQTPGWLVRAADENMVELVPLMATTVPVGRTLQFWTKADSWNAPVSLGLVEPGQTLRIPLDQLPPLQTNQLFELTLEPEGGSPSGLPTGPIQFIGRTVRVM